MFRPKLSPGKKTGDLKDRNVPLSTAVNQNMAGGGRYGVNECLKEAKKATQKSLSEVKKTKTVSKQEKPGGTATPVTLNPEKSIVGQTYN